MIKIEYKDNDITLKDSYIYLKYEEYYDDIIEKDINVYLKREYKDNDIISKLNIYDQYHLEYKRILELFNFGV